MPKPTSLRQIFPNFPENVIEVKEQAFITKLRFMNRIAGDINKFSQEFPFLTEKTITNLYLDYLDKMDMELDKNYTPILFPFRILMKIFKYIDFPDLIRYAMTNSKIYDHVMRYPYFKTRAKWEREHLIYIRDKISTFQCDKLPFYCINPLEQVYKNHVILKRVYKKIKPRAEPGKRTYKYQSIPALRVFTTIFRSKTSRSLRNKNIGEIIQIAKSEFENVLTDEQRQRFEEIAKDARAHGFIYGFKPDTTWCFTYLRDPEKMIDINERAYEKVLGELEISVNEENIDEEILKYIDRVFD